MKTSVIISLVIALSGCGAGSGEGLTNQGRPLEEVVEDVSEGNDDVVDEGVQPTLASIQEHVFTPVCATCHGGASPAAGQNLSSIEDSVANLINVDSSNPGFKRVLPGDSSLSYLYLKVAGNAQAGARMPLGQPALPDKAINAIKTWIDQGALVTEGINTPVTVSRVNQVSLAQGNLVVELWFNQEMNFAGLTAEQILVTATDAKVLSKDNSWLLAPQKMKLNIINNHLLQLTFSSLGSQMMHLNIQLNNSTISTLATQLGQQLDGDNNGREGGVFNYEISL
jgi:mono/diheme cytochrome c family protein